jgi:hypothetical protein
MGEGNSSGSRLFGYIHSQEGYPMSLGLACTWRLGTLARVVMQLHSNQCAVDFVCHKSLS